MINENPTCVIVDAYSTGKNLAPKFIENGISCIHVKSANNLPSKFKHNEKDFQKNITYDNTNLESILTELSSYKILCVIAGYESGVELADTLSEALKLPSNGSKYSKARRDKYHMTEIVSTANIQTVKHSKSNDLQTIIDWAEKLNDYPVVLKPLDSANGDNVFFCQNKTEIGNAFNKIINNNNQFGKPNDEALIQSLNVGQEYIVNTVSWNGKHYVAEMWRVTRKGLTTIYDKAEIVCEDEEEWTILYQYTQKVLDALHIQYGPATTELKYTKEKGATLLETSSRLMAGAPISFSEKIIGFSQLSLTVEAYLNNEIFLKRFLAPRPKKNYYGMAVILICDVSGTLKKELKLSEFKQLDTYHDSDINGKLGTTLTKTINSLTSPGEIYLISENFSELQKDYKKIREIERNGFYSNAIEILEIKEIVFNPLYNQHGLLKAPLKETPKLEFPYQNENKTFEHNYQQ